MTTTENKVIWTERKTETRTVYDRMKRRERKQEYDALTVYLNNRLLRRFDLAQEAERHAALISAGKKAEAIEDIVARFDNDEYDWLKPGRKEEAKQAARAALENIF